MESNFVFVIFFVFWSIVMFAVGYNVGFRKAKNKFKSDEFKPKTF